MAKVYWERQGQDELCALHCLNSLLQGPYFTPVELGEIAQEIEAQEKQLGLPPGQNVGMSGLFSVQVLINSAALYHLKVDYIHYPHSLDLTRETGLVTNKGAHWKAYRQLSARWYDLNSLSEQPTFVTEADIKGDIEGVFEKAGVVLAVRGQFPPPYSGQQPLNRGQMHLPLDSIPRRQAYNSSVSVPRPAHSSHYVVQPASVSLPVKRQSPFDLGPEASPAAGGFPVTILIQNGAGLTRRFYPGDIVLVVYIFILKETNCSSMLYGQNLDRALRLEQELRECGVTAESNTIIAYLLK